MHQTFDARLQLNECTVIGDVGHAAHVDRVQRELGFDGIPRIGLELLHAQTDTVGFLVDLDDLNLDGFADRKDLGGVVHTAPSHVGDVQQAIHTAEIDECAVFGDVLDDAFDFLTLGEVRDDLGALFGTAFFKDSTARHDDIAAATVHFQDLEGLLETHQRACIAHRAHIDLRAGQERNSAAQINGEAAFDATKDSAFDAVFFRIGFFKTIPGFFAARFLARDDGLATHVLDAVKEYLDFVANSDFGRFAGIGEFLEVNAAFHLVADVDDGLTGLDGDHFAFDDRTLLRGVDLEALVQEGFEFFHGCFSAHAYTVSFSSSVFWPCGWLRRSFIEYAERGHGCA